MNLIVFHHVELTSDDTVFDNSRISPFLNEEAVAYSRASK
jgi:hypothetical protein